MTDSADEYTRQMRANFLALQSQQTDMDRRVAEAAHALGKREGWMEGWNAGYNYASERFQELMRMQPPPPPQAAAEDESSAAPRAVAAPSIVLQIVRNSPGLRGVEIVNITDRMEQPLKERTVRTALHRLKMAREIYVEDEKWYPAQTFVDGHENDEDTMT